MNGTTAWFTGASFDWLAQIKTNNDKDWFAANKAAYEHSVKAPMAALLGALQPVVGGDPKLFRQHRDTRFSADKSPYRTEMIGTLHGREGSDAGLYAELSDDGLLFASGNHMWEKDQLERYLAAMAAPGGAEVAAVLEALERDGWEIQGELLKGVPKDFPKDHPRGRFLKHKFLVAGRRFGRAEVLAAKDAATLFEGFWRAVTPLNAWLDTNVGLSALPTAGRR
ncbi:MAG: DUF2461 domain-containing protein [Sphingomonas sp.]